MVIPAIALTLLALSQQPAPTAEPAVISAKLGGCSADFVVTDGAGQPVYNATIHVRIRYGFMSVKRMDVEIGTSADGKARVEGLPAKAKPLSYDVSKGELKGTVEQDLESACMATHKVVLKPPSS
jgi:hypothetical protein